MLIVFLPELYEPVYNAIPVQDHKNRSGVIALIAKLQPQQNNSYAFKNGLSTTATYEN